jgi:hypothetical protein
VKIQYIDSSDPESTIISHVIEICDSKDVGVEMNAEKNCSYSAPDCRPRS